MTTLANLRTALAAAVVELHDAEIADAIGILASASARLLARMTTPPPAVSEKLVDAAEMAAILNTPENWVRDRARAGDIPSRRLGHYVRFNPPEVLEAVRRLPRLHDSAFRGLKKAKETRGGRRPVSNECPSSVAAGRPEKPTRSRHTANGAQPG
jgi:hypothetical protein